jgi:hypothetical protein
VLDSIDQWLDIFGELGFNTELAQKVLVIWTACIASIKSLKKAVIWAKGTFATCTILAEAATLEGGSLLSMGCMGLSIALSVGATVMKVMMIVLVAGAMRATWMAIVDGE